MKRFIKLSVFIAAFAMSAPSFAVDCPACVVGSEGYPTSWDNNRAATKQNVAIPYAGTSHEIGADYSNSDLSGSWRTAPTLSGLTTGQTIVLNSRWQNLSTSKLCNSAYLAMNVIPGLKDRRGVYTNPQLTYRADLTMYLAPFIIDYSGSYLAHSNLRFAIVGDAIFNADLYDVDATGMMLMEGTFVSLKAKWAHVNLSVDPVTGHGIHWVKQMDGSYLISGVAVANQPEITDAWFYTWRSGVALPAYRTNIVKNPTKVGYDLVPVAITQNDTEMNPALITSVTQ